MSSGIVLPGPGGYQPLNRLEQKEIGVSCTITSSDGFKSKIYEKFLIAIARHGSQPISPVCLSLQPTCSTFSGNPSDWTLRCDQRCLDGVADPKTTSWKVDATLVPAWTRISARPLLKPRNEESFKVGRSQISKQVDESGANRIFPFIRIFWAQ